METLSLRGRLSRRDLILLDLVMVLRPLGIWAVMRHEVTLVLDRMPAPLGLVVALPLVAGALVVAWRVAVVVPVRRLHDMNLSGWFYLLVVLIDLVPYLGSVVAFCWLVFVPGTNGRNRFGADPRGSPDAALPNVFDGPPVAG